MNDFIGKVKDLWETKAHVDTLKDTLAEATSALESKKLDIMKFMEAMELDKQHVPGCGTVFRQQNFSVKVPKDPAQKKALFDWIASHKGQDVLDNMISVNSMTLNSFYKAELAAAQEAGDIKFKMTGIGEPEIYTTLGMRKG